MRCLRIVAVLALLVVPAAAQNVTPTVPSAPPSSPEAMAAARDLVSIISKDTLKQLVTRITAQVWPMIERDLRVKQPDIKPELLGDLRAEFERIQLEYMAGLMNDAPTIYARHFTVDELHQLIAFYRTPLGEKAMRELPEITAESMALIMPRLQTLQVQTMEAFSKLLRERGLPVPGPI